mgnify:CR=1 FL=1
MSVNIQQYKKILAELPENVKLVAVSKFKPASDIKELYDAGHRDFGENYVQELTDKQAELPFDIRWHFIGHLQSNKVKYIAPFVHLIHGVDSFKLLSEINKHGLKNNRVIEVLLQIYIASEETKFGLSEEELDELMQRIAADPENWKGVRVKGLMGMASFSDDMSLVEREFSTLKSLYDRYAQTSVPAVVFDTLSMGMSNDYQLAIRCGSTMIRVGSLLFGARQ